MTAGKKARKENDRSLDEMVFSDSENEVSLEDLDAETKENLDQM